MYIFKYYPITEKNLCTQPGDPPCKNGGTCTYTGELTYTCTCPPNLTGVNCTDCKPYNYIVNLIFLP